MPFYLGAAARRVFALPRLNPTRPTLVLDIDETILHRPNPLDQISLYAWRAHVGVPYPHALSSLRELQGSFDIVALTARFMLAEANTEAWFQHYGLGHIPIIYAKGIHPLDHTRVAFKASATQYLHSIQWRPVMGVGDRPSDLAAYLQTGLHAAIVRHDLVGLSPPQLAQTHLSMMRKAGVEEGKGKLDQTSFFAPRSDLEVWDAVKKHALGLFAK